MRMTLEDSQARVIKNNITESFNINVGVRQLDALSVTPFNLVLGLYYKEIKISGGNVSTKMAHINACVDDVIIISRNQKAL
jgi:hypothetical protein